MERLVTKKLLTKINVLIYMLMTVLMKLIHELYDSETLFMMIYIITSLGISKKLKITNAKTLTDFREYLVA